MEEFADLRSAEDVEKERVIAQVEITGYAALQYLLLQKLWDESELPDFEGEKKPFGQIVFDKGLKHMSDSFLKTYSHLLNYLPEGEDNGEEEDCPRPDGSCPGDCPRNKE